MSEQKKLVIVNSRGLDDERSSVAWSIANTAAASGMDVTVFLVAAGADWARQGAADNARPNPLDPPMSQMIETFLANGGRIRARRSAAICRNRSSKRRRSQAPPSCSKSSSRARRRSPSKVSGSGPSRGRSDERVFVLHQPTSQGGVDLNRSTRKSISARTREERVRFGK